MINKINKLSQSKFINTFGNIFENAVWIAEDLYKKKPFTDFEDLSYKMIAIFENASKEAQLKILNDHPDLGNKAKISSLTIDSLKEQTNVGLNNCTKEEFEEFERLNSLYKKKFNFPFILAVKGQDKIGILKNFRQRISSNLEEEFIEAIKQVKKIAGLRLKELKIKDN
tara:strand:+ start:630 stop:1136 length:507 start_codon:yes stop_codon:yes gene_type:complete